MPVNNKPNGEERRVTIADPPDNSDEAQAELNADDQAAEGDAEPEDDGDAIVDDVHGDTPPGFQSNDFYESIVCAGWD
jgi:hypothetical protein